MTGSLFKRCGCTAQIAGLDGAVRRKSLGNSCPRIRRPDGAWSTTHGTWWFSLEAPSTSTARRSPIRHGGYRTRREAAATQNQIIALLALAHRAENPAEARAIIADAIRNAMRGGQELPDPEQALALIATASKQDLLTVGQWLNVWLNARQDLRAATALSYRSLTDRYLIPLLGDISLTSLRADQIRAAMNAVEQRTTATDAANSKRRTITDMMKAATAAHDKAGREQAGAQLQRLAPFARTPHAATVQRIRAVLRAALSDAVEQHLINDNPAKHLRLRAGRAPRALLWTPPRVEAWQASRMRPSPVMVWTAQQTRTFLEHATRHRLYPLFLLIATLGLRRGEACGLCWSDVDLDAGSLQIRRQLVQVDGRCLFGDPKTEAGYRTLGLTPELATVLREHRARQQAQRHGRSRDITGGPVDHLSGDDVVFTGPDGSLIQPSSVSVAFKRLARRSGLPPIRLHDLRHGTATQALAAGVDIKTISHLLGHADIAVTLDVYASVTDEALHAAAEAIADQISPCRHPVDPVPSGTLRHNRAAADNYFVRLGPQPRTARHATTSNVIPLFRRPLPATRPAGRATPYAPHMRSGDVELHENVRSRQS